MSETSCGGGFGSRISRRVETQHLCEEKFGGDLAGRISRRVETTPQTKSNRYHNVGRISRRVETGLSRRGGRPSSALVESQEGLKHRRKKSGIRAG